MWGRMTPTKKEFKERRSPLKGQRMRGHQVKDLQMVHKKTAKTKAVRLPQEASMPTLLRDGLIYLAIGFFIATMLISTALQARDQKEIKSLADLASELQGSVVNISTSQKVKNAFRNPRREGLPKGLPFEKFFKDFFNQEGQKNQERRVSSLGSGFVVDPSGLIVTNNHVIKGADEIYINFDDGRKLKVDKVLGKDAKTDLALLKVTPKKPLKAVPFGSSDDARVGDWVMAIGNPFGLGGTVTVGIVSAKNRDINSGPYDEFIQTDAAINRGNSGGPLFNMKGEVIGVNTAIISPSGGSIGIGFSVPSDTVVNIIEQLKKFGETRRGWLGVLIQKVTPDIAEGFGLAKPEGALVARVTKDGPAEKAGMKVSDVIIEFDGHKVKSSRELPKIVALTPVDKTVDVKVMRQGSEQNLQVKIARLEVAEKTNAAFKPEVNQDEEAKYMGMTLSEITPELRRKYRIKPKTKGVVITKVDINSKAAEKGLQAGQVIVEVMEQAVSTPTDVINKIEEAKKSNRENAILYVARGNGEFGFVALPAKPQG